MHIHELLRALKNQQRDTFHVLRRVYKNNTRSRRGLPYAVKRRMDQRNETRLRATLRDLVADALLKAQAQEALDKVQSASMFAFHRKDWDESDGPVLWWKFPIVEPPCARPRRPSSEPC